MPLTMSSLKSAPQCVAFQLLNPICGVRARPLSSAAAGVAEVVRANATAAAPVASVVRAEMRERAVRMNQLLGGIAHGGAARRCGLVAGRTAPVDGGGRRSSAFVPRSHMNQQDSKLSLVGQC